MKSRGWWNQTLRKVKGHSTDSDVANGITSKADKDGNDASDAIADGGVRLVGGTGLVRLGEWLHNRHSKYIEFMRRVQKMLATVTIVEKEERAKRRKVNQVLIGYNPDAWAKTDAQIRNRQEDEVTFYNILLPKPLEGKHRFSDKAGLYRSIHRFLANRQWAKAPTDRDTAGTTWLELFILFDTTGARNHDAEHTKDVQARQRALERRKIRLRYNKSKQKDRKFHNGSDIVGKPTLREELKTFQAVVRHIAKHDMPEAESKWFRAEGRENLRRLANLGVEGHQPGIAAFVKTSEQERAKIHESIVRQKTGANARSITEFIAFKNKQNSEVQHEQNQMLKIKIAKIADGHCVRWKREKVEKQRGVGNITNLVPCYINRLIECTRCGGLQETKAVQLHTAQGFRAVHCPHCGKHERCLKNRCQCGTVWHQCHQHRTDPPTHAARKRHRAHDSKLNPPKASVTKLSSHREAPVVQDKRQTMDTSDAKKEMQAKHRLCQMQDHLPG